MYTTVRGVPQESGDGAGNAPGRTGPGRAGPGRRVGATVLLLGTVSFFTDLSSEMVVAVLPVYLTVVLGLSPVQYGLIDGLYQGVTAAVRIAGGVGSDLTRRPKRVAALGYGLSCACKLLFLPAGSFTAIMSVVALDRAGKGLRTAPRDAMIAGSVPAERLGYAFGVHRAMDTAGALGGPLIAFGLLAVLTDGYDAIFLISFALAAVGLAVLVLFVPDARPSRTPRPPGSAGSPGSPGPPGLTGPTGPERGARAVLWEMAGLVRIPAYRRTIGVAGLLSVTTVSDGFVYLLLRERVGIGAELFPLLFVGTAAAYLALAVPFGRLSDRIGRRTVFLAGHLAAVAAYLALWLAPAGPALVVAVLGLVGVYYAATDGVLPALTVPLVPAGVRGSGIAGVQTAMALGGLLSAVLFGAAWSSAGPVTAAAVFGLALLAAVALAARLLREPDGPADPDGAVDPDGAADPDGTIR